MPRVAANGIEIEYETYGEADARPLLLLRGLGTQLIHWDPEFCRRLAGAGHYLVIFDNRDVGLSTHLHSAGRPDLAQAVAALQSGHDPKLPYRIQDMAGDVVGLMDALGLRSAHIAGISMGGLIVQVTACEYPERIRSMTSVMAATGNPELPGPTPAAMQALMEPAPGERGPYIEQTVASSKVFGSPGFPTSDAVLRERAGQAFDRAFDPDGIARQMAAIQTSGDRRPALAALTVPTLVIHGADDPLVRVEGGRDTAATIPGAELRVIEGMGHDVPPGLYDVFVDAIAAHTSQAEAAA